MGDKTLVKIQQRNTKKPGIKNKKPLSDGMEKLKFEKRKMEIYRTYAADKPRVKKILDWVFNFYKQGTNPQLYKNDVINSFYINIETCLSDKPNKKNISSDSYRLLWDFSKFLSKLGIDNYPSFQREMNEVLEKVKKTTKVNDGEIPSAFNTSEILNIFINAGMKKGVKAGKEFEKQVKKEITKKQ